ncbi:hypothetical protein Salat_2673500 [Sesamum alatum]|uniref:Uncharacterized protein n=1 Tax=Sesamum alatum TaxID=300844 RepID=A0AAE1XPM7_9LAMI|nr:hypothetical protein Salat_2673500 [Sesamum alatum]
MEEKRESSPKINTKRGRRKKIKQVEEEAKLKSSNIFDGRNIVQQTGPYYGISSPPGYLSTPEDTSTDSRCQTRYAKALVEKEAALNAPSRSPFQNDDDGSPSVNSTLLLAIFAKYGDIGKDKTFSNESHSCLLELVCSIYKWLKVSKLMQLTPLELQSMSGQIGDLELVKVDIGWLCQRLNQISKARQLVEGVPTFKDVEARTY